MHSQEGLQGLMGLLKAGMSNEASCKLSKEKAENRKSENP